MQKVLVKVREGLEGVSSQPANSINSPGRRVVSQPATSEKYGSLDKAPATYGVVKRLRDNDMELHTDRQVGY